MANINLETEERVMKAEFVNFLPQYDKGNGCYFCFNFIPQIQFAGFVNSELTIAWLFWELRIEFYRE